MSLGNGNPQLEDGFTRIANEILDALSRTSLTDHESRCIHFLWRKTYGWQNGSGEAKKDDIIAYSQWAQGTAIGDKRHVWRTLANLHKRHIVTRTVIKQPGKNSLILWGFQKHYTHWDGFNPLQLPLSPPQAILQDQPSPPQAILSYEVSPGPQKVSPLQATEVSPLQAHTKEKKETTTKDKEEEAIFEILKKLPKWKLEEDADKAWLKELLSDFTNITLLKVKQWRDFWSTKPAKHKGYWKNRLRNWFTVDAKKETEHGADKGHSKQHGTTTAQLKASVGKPLF